MEPKQYGCDAIMLQCLRHIRSFSKAVFEFLARKKFIMNIEMFFFPVCSSLGIRMSKSFCKPQHFFILRLYDRNHSNC